MYVICSPDLEVQMAKVYSGIWPVDLRDSAYKYDQNQEKIEYQVTFKFDHYPYTSIEINQQAKNLVSQSVSVLNGIIARKYEDAKGANTAFSGAGVFEEGQG